MRVVDHHILSLEQDALQPRLTMEADGPANTKTRERTEGAATAVQAMHGDSCSTDWVDPDPMCFTSFGGDCTGPPAPPCLGENALVDNRAAAPESYLPSLEMRSPTATGGLLPTGEVFTATRATLNQPSLRFYTTEETDSKTKVRTRVLYVSYDSSFLPVTRSCRGVNETKSGKNRTFDPGGFRGRLRTCPFLGSWRASLCGRLMLGLDKAVAIFGGSMIRNSEAFRRGVRAKLRRAYSVQSAGSLKQARF